MRVDLDAITELAENAYTVQVAKELGRPGAQALKRLLQLVRQVHAAVTTERLEAGLTVISPIDAIQRPRPDILKEMLEAAELTAWHQSFSLTIVDNGNGSLSVWPASIDIPAICGSYVAYRYLGYQAEQIITPSNCFPVRPYANFPSAFGIPYFLDLREALMQYGVMCIKEAQCDTFARTWRQINRVSFRPKPEFDMRRSLQRHLRASLRDHRLVEVMPEQNVSETRPVDIKVHWSSSNRIALIEIKWLGVSYVDGQARPTQNHDHKRAISGAKQLADYLDLYRYESPNQEARGYLAVVDGRRRNVREPRHTISREDGFHFQYSEIEYPESILKRSDFESPVRLFCEPIVDDPV